MSDTRQQLNGASAVLWASAFVITALIILQAGRISGNLAHADQVSSFGTMSILTTDAGRGGGDEPDEVLYILDSREEMLMVYEIEDTRQGQIIRRTGGSLANVFNGARR